MPCRRLLFPVSLFSPLFLLCLMMISASAWSEEVDLRSAAESPRWLALLHVNRGSTLRSRHRSYVADDNFFLAADGRSDPHAELVASLHAMRDAGAEARCRFSF